MKTATYCPEDNKLRLYVGRVPRAEYEALREEGWTSTPKQSCDFVAIWTPGRRDTALSYAEIIEDEDMGPDERAADRAERFMDYREKREGEATGHADRYESGPRAHGFQSQARAERASLRHDRIGTRATDAWGKAEYWQRRTAGVISHALYVSSPAVRMGRIKEIESELRKLRKSLEEYATKYRNWQAVAKLENEDHQRKAVLLFVNSSYESEDYVHPVTGHKVRLYQIAECLEVAPWKVAELWLARHSEPVTDTDWTRHMELRLAYENQMLDAQGGRAAHVEMEAGGWLGAHQIQKVNKSNATGRVVSVAVLVPTHGNNQWGMPDPQAPEFRLKAIKTERLSKEVYRPPDRRGARQVSRGKDRSEESSPGQKVPAYQSHGCRRGTARESLE